MDEIEDRFINIFDACNEICKELGFGCYDYLYDLRKVIWYNDSRTFELFTNNDCTMIRFLETTEIKKGLKII